MNPVELEFRTKEGNDIFSVIYNGDCLEIMPEIPDGSVDMILCDLPYGTTACKWDAIIPFELLWKEYERIIKSNGAIVLFASEPFTSKIICSNMFLFKYKITWDKIVVTNHLNSKKQPMRQTEDICLFYKKQPTYNPIKIERSEKEKKVFKSKFTGKEQNNEVYGYAKAREIQKDLSKYPTDLISLNAKSNECNGRNRVHPTQKPVALFEYLIKTYTNEGDIILDNAAGSGTTGEAAKNTGRNSILIEKEGGYYQTILKRLRSEIV